MNADENPGAWGTDQQQVVMDQVWKTIQPQTIDWIMEHAEKKRITSLWFTWNDVGSWGHYLKYYRSMKMEIFITDRVLDIETDHTLYGDDHTVWLL